MSRGGIRRSNKASSGRIDKRAEERAPVHLSSDVEWDEELAPLQSCFKDNNFDGRPPGGGVAETTGTGSCMEEWTSEPHRPVSRDLLVLDTWESGAGLNSNISTSRLFYCVSNIYIVVCC